MYKNIEKTIEKQKMTNKVKIGKVITKFLLKFGIDVRRKVFKQVLDGLGGALRFVIIGGAPADPKILKFFNDIGVMLLNGYGITECSPLVSVNNQYYNDSTTVGHILPCCEIKFENVTPDGDGEICVKGDIVMKGYYKEQEKTDRVLKDGWTAVTCDHKLAAHYENSIVITKDGYEILTKHEEGEN